MRRTPLQPRDLALLPRIAAWSFVLPFVKRVLPLPALVRLMERYERNEVRDEIRGEQLVRLVSGVLRFRSGDPNCLERSLILYRYLPLAGLDSELVIGFKEGVGGDHAPIGHAWILVDGEPFEEPARALEDYGALIRFAQQRAGRKRSRIRTPACRDRLWRRGIR